jgi:hypothetical protein
MTGAAGVDGAAFGPVDHVTRLTWQCIIGWER